MIIAVFNCVIVVKLHVGTWYLTSQYCSATVVLATWYRYRYHYLTRYLYQYQYWSGTSVPGVHTHPSKGKYY